MWGAGWHEQALRLKEVLPNAKLILVIRDPIDSIESLYKYVIQHDGYTKSLADSIEWRDTPYIFYKKKLVQMSDFLYDEQISFYKRNFNQVLVLRYESFLQSPLNFLSELESFVGQSLDIGGIDYGGRINNSTSKTNAFNLRRENAKNICLDFFEEPKHLQEKGASIDFMSDDLRNKIVGYVQGRCAGYY